MRPIGKDEDERIKRAIAEALDRDGKPYRKNGEFRAKRVSVAASVETILADGRKETRNVAAPGDYVVTGPGGEHYVVKPEVSRRAMNGSPAQGTYTSPAARLSRSPTR